MTTKNLLIFCATLLIAGILFWPTIYRYDTTDSPGFSAPVRMNRLTGRTEYLLLGEWRPAKVAKKQGDPQPIPSAERSLITGKASLNSRTFNGEIYNGTDWTVTSITFRIIAKEKSGDVRWDRKFRDAIQIDPLASAYFNMTVTEAEGLGSFDWTMDEVLGYKAR